MAERFFLPEAFPGKFREEMILAADVYRRILASGFPPYACLAFDAYFLSDTREKTAQLGERFTSYYDAQVTGLVQQAPGRWELTVTFPPFPVEEDNLLCWAADLLLKGYEHDCLPDGYGADTQTGDHALPDESGERLPWYFEEGLKAYNRRNFSTSAIYFTSAIRIFPENPNAWYSRAIAKDQLFLHAKAREDYDQAIALSPIFVEAYINRGVNKELTGAPDAALEDFDKAISLDAGNAMAYFNRGNTRRNMGDAAGACADWGKAAGLGAAYAEEQLRLHCK